MTQVKRNMENSVHREHGWLHPVALAASITGAVGAGGLMLLAGHNSPRLLLALLVLWVLSPFVVLGLANLAAKRWPASVSTALAWTTLAVTTATLIIYAVITLPAAAAPRAFLFLVVPFVSWLLISTVVVIAMLKARQ